MATVSVSPKKEYKASKSTQDCPVYPNVICREPNNLPESMLRDATMILRLSHKMWNETNRIHLLRIVKINLACVIDTIDNDHV